MSTGYEEPVLEHYRKQATEHGHEPTSTMADQTTRAKEIQALTSWIEHVARSRGPEVDLLEVGCGNGLFLSEARQRFPRLRLTGIDFSPDMVELARARAVPGCRVERGDARKLQFPDGSFDLVLTERCLVNLLDPADQARALGELRRVTRPGGYVVLIEAFLDGLANLNRARTELGLPENIVPHHNLWFEKERFLRVAGELFEVLDPAALGPDLPPSNFLSSHYFISRVLYPAITRAPIRYNTELVQFFGFLPPRGEYSPIEIHALRKPAR